MNDEQKAALQWLDRAYSIEDDKTFSCPYSAPFKATLKAMLARPALPEEFPEEAMAAMWEAGQAAASPMFVRTPPNDTMRRVFVAEYRALYAHLTAPKTKEVEVEWWGVMRRDGSIDGVYACEANAKYHASGFAYTVVRLTGKATVPA